MSLLLDPNGLPYNNLDSFGVAEASPAAFDGGTSDARGDKDGTQASFTLFTVTGEVLVRIFGICTVDLVGAGTLEVGVAGNTAELIAQVANATTIDKDDIWLDGTVDDVLAAVFADVKATTLIVDGADIVETSGSADITAGNIRYICLWRALSKNGKVVSAVKNI